MKKVGGKTVSKHKEFEDWCAVRVKLCRSSLEGQNVGKYGEYLPQNSMFHLKVKHSFPLIVQNTEE